MTDIGSNDSLTVTIAEDGTVVAVGDIDMAGGPVLEASIARREAEGPVVVDLSRVVFIDSSGLRTLLAASRRAAERAEALTLRAPSREVSRLLEITGTSSLFSIEP
jgi:anti-sigma B factor antagonist